jgi:hypothetical protein
VPPPAVTVTSVLAVVGGPTVERLAVTVVGPAATVVSWPSSPAALNFAFVGSDDVQVTLAVASKLVPSAKLARAVNCRFWPAAMEGAAGVMAMLAGALAVRSCQVVPRS